MKTTNNNNIRPAILLAFVLALFSCSPSNRQKENKEITEKEVFRLGYELILENEKDKETLMTFLEQGTSLDIYQWKNHVLLWGWPKDTTGTAKLIHNAPVEVKTKFYQDPFYAFNREERCKNRTKADQWKDYLLTANLVEDQAKQREYLDYHKTQFEEWPEIAEGFCNAEFQQLLVFRNGRQLLLVISIPSGKTLDELNPKTTENNPRVDEWNAIMSQYQEGIPGTEEDEIWVFLEKN
ncbi:L-rhamnose mutarotase [Echinicola jeungdonensis]|uniref:L-rhamnose mutarotase n=1 Tax=Echinicola jeungdonensis TaxID=709343 RepID=A0ABV5J9L7_9BACT|nr:L-rhamnose mutarotase [Echinicola jeungdonensis]MDN3670379.1 L-rhamnose mutarotase [Echinicola jeungdonensis]